MSSDHSRLPSAQEVAESLDMPLEEAQRLLDRMQSAPTEPKRPMFGLVEMLATAAIAGVLAVALFPVLAQCRGTCSHRGACLSNVKQLTIAMLMYSTDYDERLPPATVWQDELFLYHKNPSILICTERKELMPAYSYNALLHCRRISEIRSPATQPGLFESSLGKWNGTDLGVTFAAPHNNLGALGYVDGHVKLVQALPPPDAGLNYRQQALR